MICIPGIIFDSLQAPIPSSVFLDFSFSLLSNLKPLHVLAWTAWDSLSQLAFPITAQHSPVLINVKLNFTALLACDLILNNRKRRFGSFVTNVILGATLESRPPSKDP